MAVGAEQIWARDPNGQFDDFFAALYQPMVQFCRRLTQYADPEDLAQEALIRAWPYYVEGKDMWPLVVTIARRMAIDAHRRTLAAQVRNRREAASWPRHTPGPEEALEQREEGLLARRAMAQLSPRYQRLLTLRDIDERSYIDIATLEGTSLDVARSTIRRARAALRAAYRRASQGAAAVIGLRRWASRRSGRVQTTLGPLTQQGLTTLAGAVAVIAVAAGVAAPRDSAMVTTTSPHAAAEAIRAAAPGRTGGGPGSGPGGRGGTGTASGSGASSSLPGPRLARPDRIVGPVGVGGDDYGHRKTEDAEIKIELDLGGQVLVGAYANPKKFASDPLAPLKGEQ
jgi:RNA polymerase sigma-70 factor (ECF subfamily)